MGQGDVQHFVFTRMNGKKGKQRKMCACGSNLFFKGSLKSRETQLGTAFLKTLNRFGGTTEIVPQKAASQCTNQSSFFGPRVQNVGSRGCRGRHTPLGGSVFGLCGSKTLAKNHPQTSFGYVRGVHPPPVGALPPPGRQGTGFEWVPRQPSLEGGGLTTHLKED